MNQFLITIIFVIISIGLVVLMPFVNSDTSFIFMMGSLLSMMIGLMPLLYYKYGGKISLSKPGKYVDNYDKIYMDERLWEYSVETLFEVSDNWFKKNLYKLEKEFPSKLRGYWEDSSGEASSDPKDYARIVNISIKSEPPLSRVIVSIDSPYVLDGDRLIRFIEALPAYVDKYWSYLKENLENVM